MKPRIRTDHAPASIGPYSQAIVTGNTVYTAGQTPIDPATGKLIEGTIEEQTHRVLQNIKSVLEASGSSLDKVVKSTVFLSAMSDFAAMNAVYAQYFNTDAPPARSTVQVAGLPLGAKVEIETIATLD
jgi:2-iminobutanoate/2-iminopropanoate deaminase